MNKLIILITMIFAFSACTPKQEDPENWTNEQVDEWFEKKEWLNGWGVKPDESINKRSFAIDYFKNKKHWDQAFQFLKSSDLINLPVGRQDLEGDHLYISVDEYTTKDKKDTRYESHRKYIDIQYVIEGEEMMGLTTLDKVEITEPYNEEKDIAFYSFDGGEYIKATPENFVLFFPEDAHRPMMEAGANSKVKKIVVKVMAK
ncbi:YhcH/YjgK/YiaL family protein [Maribellus maritimus]|uniref:YhcH/YjgK/YiaL family protein n=1 Tax=Maribellus maritimus TaxID=2870838 RepID=UPI001EEBF162|nr:YhcH/YjgK/YiaL family protein [Maribellus maritimus]MCG6188282.1 YhcH/YjgK/YiaL family protein [Maribellus maritimus]